MRTWEKIVALYRLTLDASPHNLCPRFNVYPTTTIDTIASHDGERNLVLRLSSQIGHRPAAMAHGTVSLSHEGYCRSTLIAAS